MPRLECLRPTAKADLVPAMTSNEFSRPRSLSGRVDDGVLKRMIFEVPGGILVTEHLDLDHPAHRGAAFSGQCLQPGVRQRVYSKEAFQDIPEPLRRPK
jgi:hypothetical protein